MKIKINKKELEFFFRSLRLREAADDLPFSDDELINELILYIENNPSSIVLIFEIDEKK
jgi:hypothetical protein